MKPLIKPALAVLGVLLYALAFQGCRPIWEPDEGRYTAVALQMVASGDVVHPRLHPEHPHYSKPPLTYWALAASFRLLGRNEWAARLPNALALAGLIGLAFALGRKLTPAAAWLPAFVVATMPGPLVAANVVTTDTLLTLWETLAAVGFVSAWYAAGPLERRRGALVMWLGFGLAFLTKGPPGLLPLAAFALFAFVERRAAGLRVFLSASGIPAFLVLSLGWFVLVVVQRPVLLHYFLYDEFVERIASGVHRRNPEWYGPLKAYLPGLLIGSLPWTVVAGRGLWRALREAVSRPATPGREADRLLALWFLVPLVVLSLARSRLPLYVLPLFVPLALMAARALAAGVRRPLRAGRAAVAVAVACAAVGLRAAPWPAAPHRDASLAAERVEALVGGAPVSEVLFVDTRPWYGLTFYLGADVDRARLERHHPLPDGRDESLAHHLERPVRGVRLLAAWPQLLGGMREQAAEHGERLVELGDIDGLLFSRLEPAR